jgi:transcriptional regulator with XRE-family HTH domain
MDSIPGSVLRSERDAFGVGQEAVARLMDVSVKTIQRLEASGAVRRRIAEDYRAAIIMAANSPDSAVPRGTLRVGESVPSFAAPDWLDLRIENTVLEFARAGATNEQARYIRDVLRSDATLRFVLRNDDGSPRSARQQDEHVRDLVEGFRFWVERSKLTREGETHVVGEIQPQTPGAAPLAPVYAAPDPGVAKPNVAQPRGKKK